MEIGIFARTFPRPTLDGVLDAVRDHGINHLQFNMECAGLDPMPDQIPPQLIARIRSALAERGLTMASLSGTFNMAHPDPAEREAGLRRLRVLAEAAGDLGTGLLTLCTGTRNTESMWRPHPDNNSPEAWRDMVDTVAQAARIAEETGVTLGFEPEVSNVVDSAEKGRRLLDEIASPHLKVVIDGANLFPAGQLPRMRQILDRAFDLLGADIALAHAKDLSRDGEAGHEAAGTGLLDYDHYLALLRAAGFEGALVLHSLSESQVPAAVRFLQAKLTPR